MAGRKWENVAGLCKFQGLIFGNKIHILVFFLVLNRHFSNNDQNKLAQQEHLTKQLRRRQKELKEDAHVMSNQKTNFQVWVDNINYETCTAKC